MAFDREDSPVTEIHRYLREAMIRRFPDASAAVEAAVSECMARFLEEFGGQTVYWPKHVEERWQAQYKAIRAEFNGTNHAALARKYGKSVMRIRQIVQGHRGAAKNAPKQQDV